MSRELKPCGTPAAYKRHRARGEAVCEACRVANYAAQKAQQQARSQARQSSRVVFPTLSADTFADAICHQEGPDLWEPARDEERAKDARARWREAAKLCEVCPALGACARLADAQDIPAGVWAGRVPRIPGEREHVSRSDCGTTAGYQRHKRAGEKQCGPCLEANRVYMRGYMARSRAGAL